MTNLSVGEYSRLSAHVFQMIGERVGELVEQLQDGELERFRPVSSDRFGREYSDRQEEQAFSKALDAVLDTPEDFTGDGTDIHAALMDIVRLAAEAFTTSYFGDADAAEWRRTHPTKASLKREEMERAKESRKQSIEDAARSVA